MNLKALRSPLADSGRQLGASAWTLMRSTPLITGLSLTVISTLSTASGQSNTDGWSGSIDSRPVTYRIRSGPELTSFQIASPNEGVITATNVGFEGINVRFRANFRESADCTLHAVPGRGYKGSCVHANGDSVVITLVPPVAGMLLPDHEIALARDAGAPRIARDATVFVFTTSGYAPLVRGTNAFTCFIERPTANDLWPMCHNREAADKLVPVEQFRARLRLAGASDAAIGDSVLRAYDTGRFMAPPPGAMAYMLSRYAWTASVSTGEPTFLGPHLHLYMPYASNATVGVDTAQRPFVPMRVEREGRPDASLIVAVKVIDPK